jgi:hypothetical protein
VVFAAPLKVTVPFPELVDPPVTVTQLAPLAAVQAHPVGVVTDTLPVPPIAATACVDDERLKVQLTPGCVTVKLWPAIVSVAVRAVVVVFAAALKLTVPLAEPLVPPVTVTQLAPLVAVHAQPVVVVTATLPVPPAAATACVEAERLNAQFAPVCVTVKVFPAMVSVPVRDEVAVVAVTAKVTVPFAEPEPPPVTISHDTLLVALHAHPTPAVTPTAPLPPDDVKDCDVDEMTGAHGPVNAKVLDRPLVAVPPGPTADTRVS